MGPPVAGRVVSCSQGTWSGDPPLTYEDQWLLDSGTNTVGTGPTYKVKAADAGHRLACSVVASNAAGSSRATSQPVITERADGSARAGRATVRGTSASVLAKCAGSAGQQCMVVLRLSVTETAQGGLTASAKQRKVLLGTKRVTIAAGRSKTVTVRLGPAGLRLLRSHVVLTVTLTVAQSIARSSSRVSAQTITFKVK
jgi:hypothetical protein